MSDSPLKKDPGFLDTFFRNFLSWGPVYGAIITVLIGIFDAMEGMNSVN